MELSDRGIKDAYANDPSAEGSLARSTTRKYETLVSAHPVNRYRENPEIELPRPGRA